jgi:hypothetical protein
MLLRVYKAVDKKYLGIDVRSKVSPNSDAPWPVPLCLNSVAAHWLMVAAANIPGDPCIQLGANPALNSALCLPKFPVVSLAHLRCFCLPRGIHA